ncbi:pyridoxal phosphate-dependent aminotransferase [Azohydromonas lata]|uniref:Aminotransferase n=1 Tax=Azohydromonas lata TaxID=45677 RepID=A0ABU5IS19_9BURK|nr:aminotransferase class I/II-fold pyridoxal phosphate-dependent enzyme [Azohydromonas lata]MDZ5461687.1 aminotransferase class I/II-fold pyridoxal phosphate-dependent enzyme [Azohydromonas lata]
MKLLAPIPGPLLPNPFPGMAWLEAQLGHPIVARLGANEAWPLGDGQLRDACEQLAPMWPELLRQYPDPSAAGLRQRLAQSWHADPEQLLIDAGADSLLLLALRTACSQQQPVITSAGTYPTLAYFAAGLGLPLVEVPYALSAQGRHTDLDGLHAAAWLHKAGLVYLADPDNPTGSTHPFERLEAFAKALPPSCLLLLDEAYADFAAEPRKAQAMPGVIRVRSFSKSLGLAGLRLGCMIAETPLLEVARFRRIHYSVSGLSQALLSHLLDSPLAHQIRSRTLLERERLRSQLLARGLEAWPSATNFVTVRCTSSDSASALQRRLWQQQIAIHRPAHPAMADVLRITVQPQAFDESLLDALQAHSRLD